MDLRATYCGVGTWAARYISRQGFGMHVMVPELLREEKLLGGLLAGGLLL